MKTHLELLVNSGHFYIDKRHIFTAKIEDMNHYAYTEIFLTYLLDPIIQKVGQSYAIWSKSDDPAIYRALNAKRANSTVIREF